MVFTPQQSKLSGKNPGAQGNAVNIAHEESLLKIWSSPFNRCQEVSNMGRLRSSDKFFFQEYDRDHLDEWMSSWCEILTWKENILCISWCGWRLFTKIYNGTVIYCNKSTNLKGLSLKRNRKQKQVSIPGPSTIWKEKTYSLRIAPFQLFQASDHLHCKISPSQFFTFYCVGEPVVWSQHGINLKRKKQRRDHFRCKFLFNIMSHVWKDRRGAAFAKLAT